ncbi:NADH-quinone oxidoreductase subunit J, partial [Streptomyces sp. NPDC086033]|uniref:NADH-quinone oxidoreductase subunit J n=1 Tax=Streptomyces sp. NPDC086033 TaxID=3365747 RepID=UPI0037D8DD95
GQRWLALLCGLGFGILLFAGIGNASLNEFNGPRKVNADDNVQGLAVLLFSKYVLAFEITSALLITATVGAVVLTHRERIGRAATQREWSEARVRDGRQLPPLPAPGVYARHNGVDIPGLLPDGTPSELTVNPTLRARGQMRRVSRDLLSRVEQWESSSTDRLGRPASHRRARGPSCPPLTAGASDAASEAAWTESQSGPSSAVQVSAESSTPTEAEQR